MADGGTDERGGPTAWDHVKRAFWAFQDHQMMDRAASLTYFGMVSLFPGMLMVVALLTLVDQADLATRAANYLLDRGADPTTAEAVRSALRGMIGKSNGAAGVTLVVSLALALNGASASFAAAGRALNLVRAADDDRSFVNRKADQLRWTLAVVLLVLVTVIAVFLGGQLADDLLGALGLGDTGAQVWGLVRWPLALLSIGFAFAIVYRYAPEHGARYDRLVTPGLVLAVCAWALVSLAFSVYLGNFGSYGAAYGTFGAAIVLLLWLYVTATAFLFGAELDEAVARARTAGRGGPPPVTPPPGAPREPEPHAR